MVNSGVSGILVVDKPAGWTSHQVVGRCRQLYATKKVGHAGTLDPMATGVLIVGINRATRLLGHLALHDKAYLATIRLGESSSTDDADGELRPVADASGLTDEQIEAAMVPLRGHIQQVPSSVSAIKVNGQRAYALVRSGEDVKLVARQVDVTRFVVCARRRAGVCVDLDVAIECSSGTYVRALARDLGLSLCVGGHLTSLRRTRIGRYDLSMAAHVEPLPDIVPPLLSLADAARLSFATLQVDAATARDVGFGRSLALSVPGDPTGLIGPDGRLLALYQPDNRRLGVSRPLMVVAP